MKPVAILLATLFCLTFSAEAKACSCALPANTWDGVLGSTAIFTGRIDTITDFHERTRTIQFAVDRVWKGDIETTFVYSDTLDMCGFPGFTKGQQYLIFLLGSPEQNGTGGFYISQCSRSKPLDQAQLEIRYLNAIFSGADTGHIDRSLPAILASDIAAATRIEAAQLLGSLAFTKTLPEGAMAAFVTAAYSTDVALKRTVASVLSVMPFLNHAHSRKTLHHLLHDPDLWVKAFAARALRMMDEQEPGTVEALLATLAHLEPKDALLADQQAVAHIGHTIALVAITEGQKKQAVGLLEELANKVTVDYVRESILADVAVLSQGGVSHRSRATTTLDRLLE